METFFYLVLFGSIVTGVKTLINIINILFYKKIYNNVEINLIELHGGIINNLNWNWLLGFIACLIILFTI